MTFYESLVVTTFHKSEKVKKKKKLYSIVSGLVAQPRPAFDPVDCSPPGSSVHGIFQARILEWIAICHFLLQGIFLTQESNLGLLHWQAASLPLSHLGCCNQYNPQCNQEASEWNGEGKGRVGGAEGREGTAQSGHSLVGHGEDLGFGSE